MKKKSLMKNVYIYIYICEKEFSTNKKYRKVRDHCHYTARFRNSEIQTVIYKLKSIDSFRCMLASLSSLVDNLSEIYKKECES